MKSVLGLCFILYLGLEAVGSVQGHLYGGRRPISTDDPDVLRLSKWAAKKLGGQYISVEKAEVQVVSGIMYYLNFTMRKTGHEYSCNVKVWTQEWLHHVGLVNYGCKKTTYLSTMYY